MPGAEYVGGFYPGEYVLIGSAPVEVIIHRAISKSTGSVSLSSRSSETVSVVTGSSETVSIEKDL